MYIKFILLGVSVISALTLCQCSWMGVPGNGGKEKGAVAQTRGTVKKMTGVMRSKADGQVVKDVAIANVKNISIRGFGDLIVTQGDKESLRIQADKDLMPYVETTVVDNILQLSIEPDSDRDKQRRHNVRYWVTVKDVQNIDASGSVKIMAPSIKTDDLRLDVRGSVRIDATVDVQQLMVVGAGAGEVILQGTAGKQVINLSGAGFYDASKVQSNTAVLDAKGASRAIVRAKKEITGSLAGASHLMYADAPKVTVRSSGASSMVKIK